LTPFGDLLCCFCDEDEVFQGNYPEIDKQQIWKRVSLLARPDGSLTLVDHSKWFVEIEREGENGDGGEQKRKPKRCPEDYLPGQVRPDGTIDFDKLTVPNWKLG
jgi:hypothetical protein